jgi:GST-like protein
MIDLYTWGTANGRKVSIMLEECGLRYRRRPVNLDEGAQRSAEFLAINPDGKIPVIVDSKGPDGRPFTLRESGAILVYLAGKTGRFLPKTTRRKYEALQWLMFQMSAVGPKLGEARHFLSVAKERLPYAIDRFTMEAHRLYDVLDGRLGQVPFLAGEYSIADIATYPWVARHDAHGISLPDFPRVKRWFEVIGARPAVMRGMAVPP